MDTKEIMETAKKMYCVVAKKLNVEISPMFLASKVWVDKFMARHNVKILTTSGEAASGDRQAVRVYSESLKIIIQAGQFTLDESLP